MTKELEDARRTAGRAIQAWALELGRILSPDDSARLMLAGALAAMQAAFGVSDAADMLRQAADRLEAGKQREPSH